VSALLAEVLKEIIGRGRPPASAALIHAGGLSMPSTDAALTSAAAVALYLGLTWLDRGRRRLAGAALLVSAAALYFWLGGAWWLGLALLFAPDLAAAGFAFGSGFGVTAYNATHRPIVPLALLGVGLVAGSRLAVLLALIWLGHIGMDRAVGYGLKDIVRTSGGK
jgi:hypothetical protein